jgi:RND family efflux transporter MFP subunit
MTLKPLNLLLLALLLSSCNQPSSENSQETDITATVSLQTQPLSYNAISQTISVYGQVIASPEALQTLSVPFASYIDKVMVRQGQKVSRGQPLLSIKPSEDVQLALTQARQELASSQQELGLVQQRLALKIATQHEQLASELRVAQAKALLQDLTRRGSMQTPVLTAKNAGVITALAVQQGQRLASATPLLQWLDINQLSVTVGVEPENIEQLQLNQPVALNAIHRASLPMSGRVIAINAQIDPLSHLLNVIVKPDKPELLLLNEAMQAEISLATKTTLVAPRAAVLPDEDAYKVFTVVNNKAVKHKVELGLQTESQVELIAPTLKAGDELVILGNYELEDGMSVETLHCNVCTTGTQP